MTNPESQVPAIQNQSIISPFLGGTVLEAVAKREVTPIQAHGPAPTPPVPFRTHTTSGEGMARMNDDEDQEYLYE